MKTEAPNKASSRHQTQRRTQAYDVLAQPPEVAQGLGGDPGPYHGANLQTSTGPGRRLDLSDVVRGSHDEVATEHRFAYYVVETKAARLAVIVVGVETGDESPSPFK
ncbi:hypothetical protein HPB52_001877 [Rhipicephalus sanguineus]|uniref:Uncharacterized protein n=1 Tax=Rhipicephalus sanguineus TaxID=34632 RepID=A0A9D4QBR8_RHISA|nr:hypothetical protein HPB52_001877 [Rhipicephalus sanguineus]